MRRLLAGIVVMAVIGLAIAGCGSSRSHASSTGAAVKVTPRLKRMLAVEIARLRAEQPKAPRTVTVPRATVVPEAPQTCLVVTRCSETPCRKFATAPAVNRAGSTGPFVPGGKRHVPCLPAPRKLVVLSGPRIAARPRASRAPGSSTRTVAARGS